MDTSAWIELLRDAGSKMCNSVGHLPCGDLALCEAIRMEVLAGARNEAHFAQLHGVLAQAALAGC